MFPIRVIVPLRMCHTAPLTSRSRVVRSPTASTVPVAGPASTTSPTPYWSSKIMNIPVRKSRTRVCAPKAIAMPITPALATSGARSIPSVPRMVTKAIPNTVKVTMLRRTEPTVSLRCRIRSGT